MVPVINWDRAYQTYIDLVNQGRKTKKMTRNLTTPKTLDNTMTTKFALLDVLTTGAWCSVQDIGALLDKMQYSRGPSAIRRGLNRLKNFGFAEVQKRGGDRHGAKEWRMTQHGLDFKNDPNSKPATTVSRSTRPAKGQVGTMTSSKGSSGGIVTMCKPINKPSLITATEGLVSELIVKEAPFSAWRITQSLREGLDQGNLPFVIDPTEIGTVFVKGKSVPKIIHEEVRAIVHEMYDDGKMTDYDRVHDAANNFWVYQKKVATAAPGASSLDPDPVTPQDDSTTPVDKLDPAPTVYDGTPTL